MYLFLEFVWKNNNLGVRNLTKINPQRVGCTFKMKLPDVMILSIKVCIRHTKTLKTLCNKVYFSCLICKKCNPPISLPMFFEFGRFLISPWLFRKPATGNALKIKAGKIVSEALYMWHISHVSLKDFYGHLKQAAVYWEF